MQETTFTKTGVPLVFLGMENLKQPKYPLKDEWIKNGVYTHTHTHREYYSAMRRKGILSFAIAWMDLEGIRLSEISQRKPNTI